ncbi:TrmB family transcriptional regulator [Halobaculum rubrum]|uniref:TrmB family transcriptional regulator n=1 Tax=Halobaculum rubrum TaxID=2872158 RepID=UPI0031F31722
MASTHADAADAADTAAADVDEATPMTQLPNGVSSPRAKLVYLYLATHGAVREDNLCDGLSMKRISLYSILQTLREAGHVEKSDGRYALA